MKQATWISLIEASTRYSVPYITLYRWCSRASKRGEVREMGYGQWKVNSNDLEKYLWRRAQRAVSGDLDRRREQSRHALQALQMKRLNQKEQNNE